MGRQHTIGKRWRKFEHEYRSMIEPEEQVMGHGKSAQRQRTLRVRHKIRGNFTVRDIPDVREQ